ncbi:MAG: exodeoxyribonuclease VII small subunit [Alphaproteobacteria bacterium TMED87]|nr:exodeoxyribonuclease VII small subunit [Rhodospirillaceae bacterium]OUV10682.1 MAG: exodeoxyribonuclease VII small subunit [Alphaproteobacteria bacterium TMED87]|tara:strand:- start:898 stop:1146 length:249 start_codon:yes stop_codon:yes gene_type:complete
MNKEKNESEFSKLSFEEALEKLEEIVRDLESGNVSLDDSVRYYEEGSKLMKFCEKKLTEARMKVEKVSGINEIKELEATNLD